MLSFHLLIQESNYLPPSKCSFIFKKYNEYIPEKDQREVAKAENNNYYTTLESYSRVMAERLMPPNLRSCVNHFSHSHPLRPIKVSADEEIICSGCGLDLSGPAYKCSKSNCEFILHKSCFNLERVIEHQSHPDHLLTLLSTPPKNYIGKDFICNACYDTGTSFDYHCASCNFDLHVGCANLPKKMKHVDHQHPLALYYSSSCNRGIKIFICDVCDEVVPKKQWVYYCAKCDYGTHLSCTYPEC